MVARSVYLLQSGLRMNKIRRQPPAAVCLRDARLSEWSVRHKLGCGSHRLASPALSNHSDTARPQARCPNSALAPGKVEAEGALAKSKSTIISPRLSTVTLRHPLPPLISTSAPFFYLTRVSFYSPIKWTFFCSAVEHEWMKYEPCESRTAD